jgi:hypothetical protein
MLGISLRKSRNTFWHWTYLAVAIICFADGVINLVSLGKLCTSWELRFMFWDALRKCNKQKQEDKQ